MCLWKMQIRTTDQNILQDQSTNVVRQVSISLVKARPQLSVTPQWISFRLLGTDQVRNPNRRTLPFSTSRRHLGCLPPGRITLRTHSFTKTRQVCRFLALFLSLILYRLCLNGRLTLASQLQRDTKIHTS